jgi:hypothetical protein
MPSPSERPTGVGRESLNPTALAAAVTAAYHELDNVEALTEYSDRGRSEICEDTAREAVAAYLSVTAPRSVHYESQLELARLQEENRKLLRRIQVLEGASR